MIKTQYTQAYSALTFLLAENHLPQAEAEALKKAQSYLSTLKPHIYTHFNEGKSPEGFLKYLGEEKLLGCSLDFQGSPGFSDLFYGLLLYSIEHLDSGLRSLVSVHSSLAMYAIHKYGSPEIKNHLLPKLQMNKKTAAFALTEPLHGSDPASMQTHITKRSGQYYLSGEKHWVTNAKNSQALVVWFKDLDQYKGAVIDPHRKGVEITPMPEMMSLRTSPSFHIHLREVEVLPEEIFEVEGLKGPLSCLNNARWGVAWGALGAASACLEETLEYVLERQQFGRPLAQNQLVQSKLAQVWTQLQLGISYMLHLSQMKSQKTLTPQHVSLAKAHHVQQSLESARICRDLLGGVGVTQKFHTFRHMVNLESVNTYEGTEHIHRLIMGQQLTGLSAFS